MSAAEMFLVKYAGDLRQLGYDVEDINLKRGRMRFSHPERGTNTVVRAREQDGRLIVEERLSVAA